MKHIEVVCAIIRNDKNEIFCCKRGPGKSLAGFWEFPGGKIEQGESREDAIIREISEELKTQIKPIKYIGLSDYEYSDLANPFRITMYAYECILVEGDLTLTEHSEKHWVSAQNLNNYRFSPADIQIIQLLQYKN